jgi:phosphatidylglycerophosphate synthase
MSPSGAPGESAHVAGALEAAAVWFALSILSALVATLTSGRTEIMAAVGVVGLVAVCVGIARLDPPRSWVPTAITGARLFITGALCALGRPLPGYTIVAVVLLVFTLDWVDGQVARRTDSVSRLGAHLDNETDAFLTLTVCLMLFLRGPSEAWVLTAGLLRYLYVLVIRVFPSRGHVPPSALASRAFGIALIGLLLGFLDIPYVSRLGPMAANLLLLWSFSRSFYWSLRAP